MSDVAGNEYGHSGVYGVLLIAQQELAPSTDHIIELVRIRMDVRRAFLPWPQPP